MEEDEGFYSRERWNNWMERLRDEKFDPEDDDGDGARLFFNLQDDITIACTKAVEAYEDGEIDDEVFMEEIDEIRRIVMAEEELEENKAMVLEGVQTSLIGVMASCEAYVTNNGSAADDGTVDEYVREARRAEKEDDMDRALALTAEAGALILDDEGFDAEAFEDLEYGFVSEWVNGLDSLAQAVSEPETIEEEE
ncbi:DUF2150 family protein [Haladaptatus sp. F3-133]|jgi:hypothetical protein|uniref:DUF2150 family protein n=1 Tax=Halorutilus salinus TaxID=2487751 RepID=A0A9Q4GJ17_9EURY|nr:DUF2150 family protein [Halorutilus salinus]MCX2819443.1 DUF2150 family protein [Halorutilus salinus]